MTEASWVQIIIALLSSGGIIGAIISMLLFASGRIDKRRERLEKKINDIATQAVDLKRVELDKDKSVSEILWKIISEKNEEIKLLKEENDEIEDSASISRPKINKIYKAVIAMRKEVDSMNLMILNEEETNVFMRRFKAVLAYLDEIEQSLP